MPMSLVLAVFLFIVVLHSMEKHSYFMFYEKDTVGLTTKRQIRVRREAEGGGGVNNRKLNDGRIDVNSIEMNWTA